MVEGADGGVCAGPHLTYSMPDGDGPIPARPATARQARFIGQALAANTQPGMADGLEDDAKDAA